MALDLPSLPKKTICKNSKIKGQRSSNTKKNSMYKNKKTLQYLIGKNSTFKCLNTKDYPNFMTPSIAPYH